MLANVSQRLLHDGYRTFHPPAGSL